MSKVEKNSWFNPGKKLPTKPPQKKQPPSKPSPGKPVSPVKGITKRGKAWLDPRAHINMFAANGLDTHLGSYHLSVGIKRTNANRKDSLFKRNQDLFASFFCRRYKKGNEVVWEKICWNTPPKDYIFFNGTHHTVYIPEKKRSILACKVKTGYRSKLR